jgi:hypothetical protein
MIGFNYIYKSPQEIFERLGNIQSFWLIEYISLFFFPVLILCLTFFVIPRVIHWSRKKSQEKEKIKKKKLLTQILLQKEIEDEVEKEIQIEDEQKIIK